MGAFPIDLGSPLYSRYVELLLAADDAKQAFHRATIGGKRGEIREAELEYEDRVTDLHDFKYRMVQDWHLILSFANEIYPGRTTELLDPIYRRELDLTQEAVVALEQSGAHS